MTLGECELGVPKLQEQGCYTEAQQLYFFDTIIFRRVTKVYQ